jgi:Aspartyl/Asparaginyl beta-hydroxylase
MGRIDELFGNLEKIANEPSHALERYLFASATGEMIASGRLSVLPPRHFLMLATVQVEPLLEELSQVSEDEWLQNSRHNIAVQRETRSIELFCRVASNVSNKHNQYTKRCDTAARFPRLMGWLDDFASSIGNGTLQLARIVRLQPHGQVYPHFDRGLYYLIRDRYHLVLKSPSGSKMKCLNQTSIWQPGQVWWFNNHVTHEAFNDGDEERIHVIFDVLPHRNESLVPQFQEYAAALAR